MTVRIPPKTNQDAIDTTEALKAVGELSQGAAVPDSVAADLPTLVADHNALLASLRAAGLIASE